METARPGPPCPRSDRDKPPGIAQDDRPQRAPGWQQSVGNYRSDRQVESVWQPAVNTNDTALDAGGGVIVMLSDHVGARGDLRYFRSLNDPTNDNDFDVTLGNFDFWRAMAGLSVKF